MNNTSKIQIVPAARGGYVPNGWMRRPAAPTQYMVKAISTDQTRVLLAGNNGVSTWFDVKAAPNACVIGQILEMSEVQS
jgi:hypothetical protein